MATITIGMNSGPVTGSKNYTLSDADVQRLLDAVKAAMPPKDAEGQTIPNPTNGQIMAAWGDWFIDRTKRLVQDKEKTQPAEIVIS